MAAAKLAQWRRRNAALEEGRRKTAIIFCRSSRDDPRENVRGGMIDVVDVYED